MCRMNEDEMISTNIHVHYVMFHNNEENLRAKSTLEDTILLYLY